MHIISAAAESSQGWHDTRMSITRVSLYVCNQEHEPHRVTFTTMIQYSTHDNFFWWPFALGYAKMWSPNKFQFLSTCSLVDCM